MRVALETVLRSSLTFYVYFVSGPAYARDLTKLFLTGVPWYAWNLYATNAPRQMRNYIVALTLIPDT